MEPSSWVETLGVSAPGSSRSGRGVKCVFIINFIFLLFMDFYGGGGVGGKFAISQ